MLNYDDTFDMMMKAAIAFVEHLPEAGPEEYGKITGRLAVEIASGFVGAGIVKQGIEVVALSRTAAVMEAAEQLAPHVRKVVDSAKNSKLDVSVVNNAAVSSADAIRLRTQLKFMEDGILDAAGKITQQAAADSKLLIRGADLNNSAVISELTKDGSKIGDWGKYTTKVVTTSNRQKLQVHYYRNDTTGAINYNIDFKVNQVVQP